MKTQQEIITQLCECCHQWVDQQELVWDLEQERLVCNECYQGKDKD